MDPVRAILVEDEQHTRARLARVLRQCEAVELVGSAGDVAEARGLLERELPGVLITDLGLPDGNGLELLAWVREHSPDTLCLVITVFGDESSVVAAIRAGARGYMLKDGTPRQITEAVRELLAGGSPISPPIARYLLERVQDEPAPASRPDDPTPALTERELEILRLVARGFSHPEIADLLGISPNTVGTHVRHVYRKLEVQSRSEAVYEAVHLGLIRLSD